MAVTRLGPSGYGVKRASSFSGKTPLGVGHPVDVITRPGSAGYGVRRTGSFAGKAESGGSAHPAGIITRPGSAGYGTRRCGSFAGKTPDVPIVIPPVVNHGGGGACRLPSRFEIPTIGHREDEELLIILSAALQVLELY